MANLYLRLVLVNSLVIQAGEPWFDPHGKPQPAKVGAIFYRPESTESYSETDEKSGDTVEIVDVTPPHYEVWGKPDHGKEWEQANETLCRRVPATSVLYAEEIWPLDEAGRVVAERLASSEDSEEIDEEGEDETAPADAPPGTDPALAPPSEGSGT